MPAWLQYEIALIQKTSVVFIPSTPTVFRYNELHILHDVFAEHEMKTSAGWWGMQRIPWIIDIWTQFMWLLRPTVNLSFQKKKTGKFDQLVRSRNHRQQEGNWITQIRVYTTLNIDWFFIDDRNDNWIAVFMKKVWSQHSQRLATETSNNSFLFLFFFFWLLICLEKNFSSGRFVITAPNTNLCNVFNQMLSVGLFLF